MERGCETSKTSLTPGIFILYSSTSVPAAGLLGETLRTYSPFLTLQGPLGFAASRSTSSFSPSVSSRASALPFSKFSINRGFRRDVSPSRNRTLSHLPFSTKANGIIEISVSTTLLGTFVPSIVNLIRLMR